MSATDPTAGERVPDFDGESDLAAWDRPAEPDAGDVKALTEGERTLLADRCLGGAEPSSLLTSAIEAILAARLDAVRRKAGDERAEQAWDEGWEEGGAVDAPPKSDNPYRAARIARSPR